MLTSDEHGESSQMPCVRPSTNQAFISLDQSGLVTGSIIVKAAWAQAVVSRWLRDPKIERVERVSVEEALRHAAPCSRAYSEASHEIMQQPIAEDLLEAA